MTDNQETAEIFARHVRKLREDMHWSQAELGRRVGLGQSRVAAIEGAASVTIGQAVTFARVFGVPIEALLDEHGPLTAGLRVRQMQRLLQIYNAVDQAREQIGALVEEITADLPGKGRPGTIITADSVTDLPSLPRE